MVTKHYSNEKNPCASPPNFKSLVIIFSLRSRQTQSSRLCLTSFLDIQQSLIILYFWLIQTNILIFYRCIHQPFLPSIFHQQFNINVQTRFIFSKKYIDSNVDIFQSEHRLQNVLMTNYLPTVRPATELNKPVHVQLMLDLMRIDELVSNLAIILMSNQLRPTSPQNSV